MLLVTISRYQASNVKWLYTICCHYQYSVYSVSGDEEVCHHLGLTFQHLRTLEALSVVWDCSVARLHWCDSGVLFCGGTTLVSDQRPRVPKQAISHYSSDNSSDSCLWIDCYYRCLLRGLYGLVVLKVLQCRFLTCVVLGRNLRKRSSARVEVVMFGENTAIPGAVVGSSARLR